jgi:hypothetical protein
VGVATRKVVRICTMILAFFPISRLRANCTMCTVRYTESASACFAMVAKIVKIVPRYRTFQYRKWLGVLRDGSQEGEHDREMGIQS